MFPRFASLFDALTRVMILDIQRSTRASILIYLSHSFRALYEFFKEQLLSIVSVRIENSVEILAQTNLLRLESSSAIIVTKIN